MRYARFLVILFFICSLIYLLKPLLIGYYPDFSMHYYGTQAFFDHVSPYSGGEHFFIPHVYPPFTSVFFVPLMIFSYDTAEILWVGISILMYLASILLLFALFERRIGGNIELFLFGLLNFTFFPLKFTFGMGQVNTFVLLCVALFLYFTMKKTNELFAGNVLAFAFAMKLYPLLLIPYLVLRKKWGILISFVATFFAILFLSIIFFGYEMHKFFVFEVLPSLTGGWKDYYYNQSLSGLISVLVSDQGKRQVLYSLLSGLFLVPAVFIVILKRKNYLYCVSLILITSLLINKFSWQHHYVLLLPSLFIIIFSQKSRGIRIFTGVAYCLMAINLEHPLDYHPIIQFHALYGAILLYGMTLYRLVKGKK